MKLLLPVIAAPFLFVSCGSTPIETTTPAVKKVTRTPVAKLPAHRDVTPTSLPELNFPPANDVADGSTSKEKKYPTVSTSYPKIDNATDTPTKTQMNANTPPPTTTPNNVFTP